MLFSEARERSRRFGLALRMGVPILLLIGVVVFYILRQRSFEIGGVDVAIFAVILFISVYFIFFLINLGQSETMIDRMTGTFNRRHLMRYLKKGIADEEEYTIVLLRIENLPFINEHFGIDRGDRLLGKFVARLDAFFRLHGVKDPVIGRYHGGDFVVGLPLDGERVHTILEEFSATYKEIDKIAVELKFVDHQVQKNENLPAVITHLYDTISLQAAAVPERVRKRPRIKVDRLEQEIVEAIERGRVELSFLSTLNLRTNRVDMMEVAVKLQTLENGVLPPKKFIPVVNRLGLEQTFDAALLRAVVEVAEKTSPALSFSFNLSPFSLREESFVKKFRRIVPSETLYRRLVVELYENRVFRDLARYRMVLDELRELGVRFALDNFGGSNASLEYIRKLPVDMVRFDTEFTTSYNNPRVAALMKGYIQACRNMGVQTLVRWVDTPEALERFRQLGVDYAQGFAVSNRPLDSETLIKKYGANDEIR